MKPDLSIIVPLLNEAAQLPELLAHLHPFRQRGCEIILVDGGSSDDSYSMAQSSGSIALQAPRGRASQMNAGAARAKGVVLLFLHADTRLPVEADEHLRLALLPAGGGHADWGRFDVRIEGRSRWLPIIAWFINHRSCLTGIATGDQALFVRRSLFVRIGGYPDQPLMEDVELSTRLGRHNQPVCLRQKVVTSGRRWDRHGALRTILLMWWLRLAYWLGVSPHDLARAYR